MTQSGHNRHGEVGEAATELLIIEHGQIFTTPAAAGEHNSIKAQRIGSSRQSLNNRHDPFSNIALNRDWDD